MEQTTLVTEDIMAVVKTELVVISSVLPLLPSVGCRVRVMNVTA